MQNIFMNKLFKIFLIIIPPVILLLVFLKGKSFSNDFFLPQENLLQSGLTLPDNVNGWSSADLKWFPEEKMFEKINGRATFYIQIGVEGLFAGSWTKNGKSWSMYLYKMNNDNAAKQVFLSERGGKFTDIDIGDSAYFVGGALTFREQNLYMQFVADNPDDNAYSVTGLAVLISNQLLSEEQKEESEKVEYIFSFAKELMISGSENFTADAAFGYASLKNVDHLSCVVNSSTARWFFVKDGKDLFNGYTNELQQFGCEEFFINEKSAGGNMFGEWEMGGIINGNFFGVRKAGSKKQLIEHWDRLNSKQ